VTGLMAGDPCILQLGADGRSSKTEVSTFLNEKQMAHTEQDDPVARSADDHQYPISSESVCSWDLYLAARKSSVVIYLQYKP
jgi:hypothetical protein